MPETPVALDAMGGDHGPTPNVQGAIEAVEKDGARVVLVGDEPVLKRTVPQRHLDSGALAIVHAPDVVAMDEKPAVAARKKKDSSMRKALDLVDAGDACGALSAGNSGAI